MMVHRHTTLQPGATGFSVYVRARNQSAASGRLTDMPRTVVIVAVALLSLAAACGDDSTDLDAGSAATTSSTTTSTTVQSVGPGTVDPATEGTMLRWFETPGECHVCGFSIDFDADGTATYEGYRTRSTITFDADDLSGLISRIDQQPLANGTDDCGREVDGNAPVLEVITADGTVHSIDDCYQPIDRDHPVMEFVLAHLSSAREAEAPLLVEVVDVGGLCADGAVCRATTRLFADGTIVRDDGEETAVTEIADADRTMLADLVRTADEAALVLGPATEPCASASDGQDRTYLIGGDEDESPIVISDCDDDLATDAPLLVLVDRLVAAAVSA